MPPQQRQTAGAVGGVRREEIKQQSSSSGDVRVEPRALHVVIKVAAAARVGVL